MPLPRLPAKPLALLPLPPRRDLVLRLMLSTQPSDLARTLLLFRLLTTKDALLVVLLPNRTLCVPSCRQLVYQNRFADEISLLLPPSLSNSLRLVTPVTTITETTTRTLATPATLVELLRAVTSRPSPETSEASSHPLSPPSATVASRSLAMLRSTTSGMPVSGLATSRTTSAPTQPTRAATGTSALPSAMLSRLSAFSSPTRSR